MSNSLMIDPDNVPGDLNALRADLREAANQRTSKKPDGGDESDLETLPDKYRGKSVTDIIKMHQNAESELGRRGNELGQYKSLTDKLLALKRTDDLLKGGADPNDEKDEYVFPEVSSSELLDNPSAVLSKVVTGALTQDRQQQQKEAAKRQAQEVAAAFREKHPDAAQIAYDAEFIEWVNKSPSRALAGFQAANGDLTAGDALLVEWKEAKAQKPAPSTEQRKNPNIEAARKAGTVSTNANNTQDVPTGKVYRRLDLIRLKLEDPEAYEDPGFQREIMLAYAQGRVK